MVVRSCCNVAPFMCGSSCKSCGFEVMKGSTYQKEVKSFKSEGSGRCTNNLVLTMQIRRKMSIFRDLMDLAPCDGSISIDELVVETMEDLHKLYPEIVTRMQVKEMKGAAQQQGLACFCTSLKSIGDSLSMNRDWMDKTNYLEISNIRDKDLEKIVRIALATLDGLIEIMKKKFDMMDEDDEKKDGATNRVFEKMTPESPSGKQSSDQCPVTPTVGSPTSVLPELRKVGFARTCYNAPRLLPLRVRAVGKLNPIDVKRLALHSFSTAPLPSSGTEKLNEKGVGDRGMATGTCNASTRITSIDLEMRKVMGFNLDENPSRCSSTNDNCFDVHAKGRQLEQMVPANTLSIVAPANVFSPAPPLVPIAVAFSQPVPQPAGPAVQSQPNDLHMNVAAPPPPPPPPPRVVTRVPPPPPPPPFTKSTPTVNGPTVPPPPPPVASRGPAPPPPPPLQLGKGMAPPPPPPVASRGPPPPPPLQLGKGMAPPPMTLGNGAAPPPPPPLGSGKSLRPKKASTKLKRSTQIGNLYRLLKGKVEGSSLNGKSVNGRKVGSSSSTGGKQGMADALKEMTKRSAYFQQIEEDVQKYAKQISELRAAIYSFKNKDMAELLMFHKQVESVLENLTDESQVLARYEEFPTKKLEAVRTAAALYQKLNAMITELQNWKIASPLPQLMDKVERYFNKIKGELDTLERVKDEESKKFSSHNIHFDFDILLRIKEAIVDVSSSCMELALKERRDAKANEARDGAKAERRTKVCIKMLWRAFQFAFRVYTFAGGHDDRADKLTRELAHEIETNPQDQ